MSWSLIHHLEKNLCSLKCIFLILGLGFFASGAGAFAQTGTLHGQVTDPSGAVIPGATVSAISAAGQTFSAPSNATGNYEIRNLQPGKYTVLGEAKGFAPFEQADV